MDFIQKLKNSDNLSDNQKVLNQYKEYKKEKELNKILNSMYLILLSFHNELKAKEILNFILNEKKDIKSKFDQEIFILIFENFPFIGFEESKKEHYKLVNSINENNYDLNKYNSSFYCRKLFYLYYLIQGEDIYLEIKDFKNEDLEILFKMLKLNNSLTIDELLIKFDQLKENE